MKAPSPKNCRTGTPCRRRQRDLRAHDSGFENKKITAKLWAKGCRYSIGVRLLKPVAAAIEAIPDKAWRPVADYPETGTAEIAETVLGDERLVVRRARTLGDQQQLFATWQHFAFLTNRTEPLRAGRESTASTPSSSS